MYWISVTDKLPEMRSVKSIMSDKVLIAMGVNDKQKED